MLPAIAFAVLTVHGLWPVAAVRLASQQSANAIACQTPAVRDDADDQGQATPKLKLALCLHRKGQVIEAARALTEALADIRRAADLSQGKSTLRTTTVHLPTAALRSGSERLDTSLGMGLAQVVPDARGRVQTATVLKSFGADEAMLREIRRKVYATPVGGRPLLVVVRAGAGNPPADHIDLARFLNERGDYLLAEWALGPAAYEITAEARRLALAGQIVPDGEFGAGSYVPRERDDAAAVPEVLREVRPRHTAAARRERIEGTVLVQGIVGVDGRVSDVRVIRSLDGNYGLDNEALLAVKQWRFRPGRGPNGSPVPVFVTLPLTFRL